MKTIFKSVGSDDSGLLFGYDQDHIPMIKRPGQDAIEAKEGEVYGDWWVARFGLDVSWRKDGEPIYPD